MPLAGGGRPTAPTPLATGLPHTTEEENVERKYMAMGNFGWTDWQQIYILYIVVNFGTYSLQPGSASLPHNSHIAEQQQTATLWSARL